MRRLEAIAIRRNANARDDGISGADMMNAAGREAAYRIMQWIDKWPASHRLRFVVLAGKGNNGGDAWVAARVLTREFDMDVTLYSVCGIEELSGDAKYHAEIAENIVDAEENVEQLPPEALESGTIIIDGLLGTGLKGSPKGTYKKIIQQVNESGLPVVALDVPSGLDADTGDGAEAIQADLTVTMCFLKQGMFLKDGPAVCGYIAVVGIDLPMDLFNSANPIGEAIGADDAMRLVKRRRGDGYKGTYGHLLVLGGSGGYVGAPILSALGGIRGGAGLVT